VLEHEMKHVAAFREHLADSTRDLATELPQLFGQQIIFARDGNAAEAQVRQTLQPLLELCRNFDEALKAMDTHIARQLVGIALEAARQLAGDALAAQPEQVLVLVKSLLDSDLELTGKPKLWLHPEDLQRVQHSLGEQIEAAGWALHADSAMLPGGCRVVSAGGELDATRPSRLGLLNRSVERTLDEQP